MNYQKLNIITIKSKYPLLYMNLRLSFKSTIVYRIESLRNL